MTCGYYTKMLNIGFWENQLGYRGTTVATFDYAYYNQKILGNKSFIFFPANYWGNDPEVIERFKRYFTVIPVNHFNEVDQHIIQHKIGVIYIIKAGDYDGQISKVAKNIVHCVFSCEYPQGDIYCSISPYVAHNNGQYPVLPHIVSLPKHDEDMREMLNIPKDATVFGRHGGFEQFDIHFVQQTVYSIAKEHPNIYFLFVCTKPFAPPLRNIIHLDKIIDPVVKRKFINTCDAMLWARCGGETFGLSIAEFSICNKPVLATKGGDCAHVEFLGDTGIWYDNEDTLRKLILNFDRNNIKGKDWNRYRQFSPENVMRIFNEMIGKLQVS